MATFNASVVTGTDDAYQAADTTDFQDSFAILTAFADTDAAVRSWAGMRFQSVTVPSGATITQAYLSLYMDPATNNDDPLCHIYMEDVDSAEDFVATPSVVSRTLTTANTAWSGSSIAAGGAAYYDSPDFASAVQEVIDRAGWASGQDMFALVVGDSAGSGGITFESYEGTNAPQLTIVYSVGSGGPIFEHHNRMMRGNS